MISIVIATFNRAHTLPRCLKSVLVQEGLKEVIIVDDGSTDTTQDVLREYTDPRIRVVRLPENKGASFARNHGLAQAQGEYSMVWDSDDELFPSACVTLLAAFQKYPNAVAVSAPAHILKGSTPVLFTSRESGPISFDEILCKYLPSNEKVRLTRTVVAQKAPYVSKNLDFMVSVAIAEQGPWFHLHEPLATVYANAPDSLTHMRKKFNSRLSIERGGHIQFFLNRFGDHMKHLCPERYAALCYGAAIGCFASQQQKKAFQFASRAVTSRPMNFRYLSLWILCCIPFSAKIWRCITRGVSSSSVHYPTSS